MSGVEIPMIVKSLCAKTDSQKGKRWLPFWMHAQDTAGVIVLLIDEWMSPFSKKILYQNMKECGDKEEMLTRLGILLGLVHDIGKLTPCFQEMITRKEPYLQQFQKERGIPIPSLGEIFPGKSPHSLAGSSILSKMNFPDWVAVVVGAHHGKPQEMEFDWEEQLDDYAENYYGSRDKEYWEMCWKQWAKYALYFSGIEDVGRIPFVNRNGQMILTGLLIMADWIASNTDYFPLIPFPEEKEGVWDRGEENTFNNDEVLSYPERILVAFDRFRPTAPWICHFDNSIKELFHGQFGFEPNRIQEDVMTAVDSSVLPGLFILEAPMGIGKTEAALASAFIENAKNGCGGLFFGLPTQATANGIFYRIEDWGLKQSKETAHSIRLAHGMASINDEYKRLISGFARIGEDESDGGLFVHEWFSGKKQALLSDFVIGTVDQILMAGLKQRHVMLRHLGMTGKIVIIDECHAYDAYMNVYLDRVLEWLGAYHVPVFLLSATLPSRRRAELVEAYQVGFGLYSRESSEIRSDAIERNRVNVLRGGKERIGEDWKTIGDYPLLTWTQGDIVCQKKLNAGVKSKTIRLIFIKDTEIPRIIENVVENNGCAGIVVNTVRRAQMIYEILSRVIKDADIILYHAQYLAPDRVEKEKEIRNITGKESSYSERKKKIVVGTQVLEQSLDIDFDVMISDIAPIDLLMQRMGRLQRHYRNDRPEVFSEPIVYISGLSGEKFENGTKAVYGEYFLLRTVSVLSDKVTIPDDISALVQKVYDITDDCGLDSSLYRKAKEQWKKETEIRKRKAEVYRIGEPRSDLEESPFNTISGLLAREAEVNDIMAEAAVRDGDFTIEVLILLRDEDGEIGFLPWQHEGKKVSVLNTPSDEEAMWIAGQRINLPAFLSREYSGIADRTIRELEDIRDSVFGEWMESPWLKGKLFLVLDENLKTVLNGKSLHYSREMGMVME